MKKFGRDTRTRLKYCNMYDIIISTNKNLLKCKSILTLLN